MRRKGPEGFSLIEVILTFSILVVATTALGLVEFSNARRTQELKERDIAFGRSQAIMERILRVPFGAPGATPATGEQLDLLFGTDGDVRQITLTQLQQRDTDGDGVVDTDPIRFVLEGVEDKGEWEIFIDSDLDGNGKIETEIDGIATREGRSDLLRLEIRRNGHTVLKTLRARTPQEADEAGGALGELLDELGEQLDTVISSLQGIRGQVQSIADANKGTALADKMEDVVAKLDTAIQELGKDPADKPAARGAINGAIGDIDAAVSDGLLGSGQGSDLTTELESLFADLT